MRYQVVIALSLLVFSATAQASGIAVLPAKKEQPQAQPASPPAPVTDGTQDPFAVIGDIARQSQFTIFADSDHADVETFSFFAREENIAALAAAGKRQIYIEMLNTANAENDIQGLVDNFARDPEKTPEKRDAFAKAISTVFAEKYMAGYDTMALRRKSIEDISAIYGNAFADLVERAARHGMRVYCADNMNFATQSPELNAFMRDLQSDLPEGYSLQDAIQSSPQLMQEYQNLVLASRLNDTGLANFISRTSGPENAVIYYGILHGNRQGDLDELLGKTITRRIELHSSQAAYNAHIISGKACPDLPSAVFLLSENKFVEPRAPSAVYPACLSGLTAVQSP